MSKVDNKWLQGVLEEHYADTIELQAPDSHPSKAAWLAEQVFDVITYEDDESEWFAEIILRAAHAISTRTTFEYVKDGERRHDYLIAVNLPFFAGRLEWGGSIRGAWWDGGQTFGWFGDDIEVPEAGLGSFFEALAEFAGVEFGAYEPIEGAAPTAPPSV